MNKTTEKTLINDNRLTPTMERVRSGRVQMFRERNKEDRSFINSANADVQIQHENKAMYAKLIDEQWCWVNGCGECNGEPRGYQTYIECEAHDRCSKCGTKRKDITEVPWGGKNGWVCKPCADAKKSEIKRHAFEKLDGEKPTQWDCSHNDYIKCPHCGSNINNDSIHETEVIDCYVCDGELTVEVEYTPTYSTSIKGKRITE